MENWESEFLQMSAFVVLTAFLFQKNSIESKDPDKTEEVDRDPRKARKRRDVPWPVKKGGLILTIYEVFTFAGFFAAVSGLFRAPLRWWRCSLQPGTVRAWPSGAKSVVGFMGTSQFWFESLQNWQSEFLAVGSMVVLSIFLRQRWSAESKPVDSPHSETGE